MALSASFAGKRVLVTGGAKGIGRAIVNRLAQDNAIVTALDVSESALQELKTSLPKVNAIQCDVSKWGSTKSIVQSIGPIDHLVNNAGIGTTRSLLKITEEDYNQIFDINVKAVINITQTVVQAMIANKIQGSVVNVSSVSSERATKDLLLYSATKAALSNITKTMALEMGRTGIRVNAVCPAPVDTPLMRGLAPSPEALPLMYSRNCIRRLIKPDEVADLVLFLLSDKAAMITGQNVFIDGGYTTN
jgi:L-xylulose reductase